MDSGSSTVLAGAGSGRDKLSSLGDAALGHILSFLPSTEAVARTALLSRRWRHIFAAVHTLSLREEAEVRFSSRRRNKELVWGDCDYCAPRAPRFVADVSTLLYGRHRCARAATAPLRALRVAFLFRGGEEATKAVDGWLSYAVYNAGEALEIELRLAMEPICDWAYALGRYKPPYALDVREQEVDLRHGGGATEGQDDDAADDDNDSTDADDDDYSAADDDNDDAADDDYSAADADYDDDDDNAVDAADAEADANADDDNDADDELRQLEKDEYVVPRSLFFSCAVLRTLRLRSCWIDPPLPSSIALPSLETLHLTRVTGRRGGRSIQRLVSGCPSLIDLTLEACEDLTALSLHGACRLRRLALRCCHELDTVDIVGTPELRAFEYRGFISPERLLTMHPHAHAAAAPPRISFCAFDFCGFERGGELLGLTTELLAGVERLHVTSARLGSPFIIINHWGVSLCPYMPMLRSLQMTGLLPDDDESVVTTVARILERTPRLETLSLFFLPEPHPDKRKKKNNRFLVDQRVIDASHELRFDPHARLAAPPRDVEIPSCLRETTKEINLVHYQGSVAQRSLAKFLLCNAPVLDEVCWKVARGPLPIQTKLMEEVRGWVTNKSANMMFF